MIAACAMACLLAASVAIELAPDQPLSFVYVDDPLIIELQAEEDGEAEAQVVVRGAHRDAPLNFDIGPISLRRGGSRWCALPDFPAERGHFTARVAVRMDDAVVEQVANFCRIDRLHGGAPMPVFADLPGLNPAIVTALHAVNCRIVRMRGDIPDIEAHLQTAASAGLGVILFFDLAAGGDIPATAGRVAAQFSPVILRWEVDARSDTGRLDDMAEAVRKAGCLAPIALLIAGPEDIPVLLEKQAAEHARETILIQDAVNPQTAQAVRRAAASAGYEGWTVHVLWRALDTGAGAGDRFSRNMLELLSGGVETAGFALETVFDDPLREGYPYLSGMVQRIGAAQPAGSLPLASPAAARLFRDGRTWILAMWSDTPNREIRVPVKDAAELRLTDALNNPLPPPVVEQDAVTLFLGPAPLFLSGTGGPVIAEAATARVRDAAHAFAANKRYQQGLPPELVALIADIAQDPLGRADREAFFAVLRAFPLLEKQWHAGQLPRATAAPAIADLARIARALCVIEEYRNEPFLDPLQDTLEKCNAYQSLYLTGSSGDRKLERGDWLFKRVGALVDEAERLDAAGAHIEACAVAALAEWRARALEFALQAASLGATPPPPEPVSEIPPEPPAESAPAAAPEAAPEPEETAAPPPAAETPAYEEIIHKVARGDNPSTIARKYGITLEELLEWNNLKRNAVLHIGDKIVIRKPKSTPIKTP